MHIYIYGYLCFVLLPVCYGHVTRYFDTTARVIFSRVLLFNSTRGGANQISQIRGPPTTTHPPNTTTTTNNNCNNSNNKALTYHLGPKLNACETSLHQG